MSPPVKMAYSRPEWRARPFAKRVFPVPGGPVSLRFGCLRFDLVWFGLFRSGCGLRGKSRMYTLPHPQSELVLACMYLDLYEYEYSHCCSGWSLMSSGRFILTLDSHAALYR